MEPKIVIKNTNMDNTITVEQWKKLQSKCYELADLLEVKPNDIMLTGFNIIGEGAFDDVPRIEIIL